MEASAGRDLRCNLAVGMEGSGLIQKSTRFGDWMDIGVEREVPKPGFQAWTAEWMVMSVPTALRAVSLQYAV